ncbi:WD40 repeat domain-containing protein [Actinopolymorpha alba]|uniref:WD40 repeat domain-containing protein n=1 Tax=Actinopolymorpha alba TaxID=533267 RepID=UPI00036D0441|nr:hypothetical protein [Actinopolymorpha alba]
MEKINDDHSNDEGHSQRPGGAEFVELPVPAAGPEAYLTTLQNADWSTFTPSRDLSRLRTSLTELEQTHGVTDAHWFATGQIEKAGAVLRHPHSHPVEIDALALSPCGRYLAVGSWCGDDYERGGALQVWELATGRCVNVLDGIHGGIGWPNYARTIQWSANGDRLAVAFNTNIVGLWNPFGEDVEPIGTADVTDGNSRPPEFAVAPEGTHAYIATWSPYDVLGCIAPLSEGSFYYNSYHEEQVPQWLDRPLPEAVKDILGDTKVSFDRVFWSRDGARIYGYGRAGWACSIDVVSRQVSWITKVGDKAEAPVWSRDERLFATVLGGQVVISDAETGRPVAELPDCPGALGLSWGARGNVARLAVALSADDDEHGRKWFRRWGRSKTSRSGVAIYDDGRHRYDVDVMVMDSGDWNLWDATPWAWAPDGERAACLTYDGIEIWSLADKPKWLRTFDAPEGVFGLLWGADDVVVAVGMHVPIEEVNNTLRFVRASDGEVLGDFTFLREPSGPRPLELDGEDVGEDLRADGFGDPTFVLDDETWAAAFGQGLVIAPEDRRDDLDALLAWTVDRRFAWPIRWGGLDVVPDALAAAERLGSPLDEYLEEFRGRTGPPPAAEAWPPPNPATLDDLFQVALESVLPLHEGWDTHVSENLRHAARLRARRGEVPGATELLDAIPTESERLRGTADVAMILAMAGRTAEAREIFTLTDADVKEVLDDYNIALGASSVGGACAALGDTARADVWFDRARAGIEPETNEGENRLAVAWALVECGRVDEARAVWREVTTTPSTFYSAPLLAYLVRSGRDDLVREILPLRTKSGMEYVTWNDGEEEPLGHLEEGWFDGWEAVEVFTSLGRPDLVREWAQIYGDRYAWEELLEKAERNAALGRASRPTEADVAGLTDEYATLQKTPRAKREHPTELLIQQAAMCNHLSAVLSLIPALPDDDFNGRAKSAFRSLWIAATRADVEPW